MSETPFRKSVDAFNDIMTHIHKITPGVTWDEFKAKVDKLAVESHFATVSKQGESK